MKVQGRSKEPFEDQTPSGRPQKMEALHRHAFLRTIRVEPKTSVPKLANIIETDYGAKVVPATVRTVIRKAGYNGRVAKKKPFISKVNKKKRWILQELIRRVEQN